MQTKGPANAPRVHDTAIARGAMPLRTVTRDLAEHTREPVPGNQAMQDLLHSGVIQPQLDLSMPGDEQEREADRLADLVLRMPEPVVPAKPEERKREGVQRAADTDRNRQLEQERREHPAGRKEEDTLARQASAEEKKTPERRREETVSRQTKPEERQRPDERKDDRLARSMLGLDLARQAASERPREDEQLRRQATDKEPREDEKLRRQADEEEREQEELSTTQAQADAPVLQASRELEAGLAARRGAGQPLPPATRAYFEPRMGSDLSDVRVHTDAWAANAAREVGARAFTRGQDVFFGAGRYQPQSEPGRRLLAHELAHTIQQSPHAPGPVTSGVGRDLIQRADGVPPGGNPPQAVGPGSTPSSAAPANIDPTTLPLSVGRPDPAANTITFDSIEVPGFKLAAHRGQLYTSKAPLRQKRGYERGNPDQRNFWRTQVGSQTSAVVTRLGNKVQTARGGQAPTPGETLVFTAPTRFGRRPPRYFIGDLATAAREMVLPTWDRQGNAKSFDVDHIVELQLSNWNTAAWPNTLENMELLRSDVNQESGRVIMRNIQRKVQHFIDQTQGQFGNSVPSVKGRYDLVFNRAVPGGGGRASVTADDFWTVAQVQAGEQIVDAVQLADMSALGGQGTALVFSDVTGGVPKSFRWPRAQVMASERDWLAPYRILTKSFNTEEGSESQEAFGTLTVNIPANHRDWLPLEGGDQAVQLQRIRGARYAGYINKPAVLAGLRTLRSKRLSPIQIATYDILPDRGIYLSGQIMPELPILRGASIEFELADGDLRLFKEFRTGDFTAPRPFVISDSSLVVSLGTRSGLQVQGRVDFGIERVGQGYFQAGAGTAAGLNLEGGFNFDTRLFDPALLTLRYRDNQLSGEGRLGIPPNRVRGIRSALITVTYANERLEASGTAELTIPGVQQAGISVAYAEAEGLTIGGTLQLADNIPGVRSGSVEARVQQQPDGEWAVTARGTAVPSIPGVDATLDVAYENGAITLEGRATFSRGMMSGSLQVGATNRPVDDQGQPVAGGEPGNSLRAYGGGSLTVRFAPWLQGTVGVHLLPNGEIEVSGSVGLPSSLEVFPEKRLDRNIFSIGIDIPIVGVAIAGQRIGIFATIRGGLDASAGIGPGQLRELNLAVTYNPAHEEQTHVTGQAELFIPAHAGLRLFVRGGLGIGIPIVSASANLEVAGTLGLEGAVRAAVTVDWMPTRGLSLDALGEIYVQPRFRFDVTGMVLVEADLLLTTIELYSKRWNLASFEYGSDLRFGVRFPVHYREGQPFDISLSDVEFEVPRIDPQELLAGLVRRVA